MLREFVVCNDCAPSIKKGSRLIQTENICGSCWGAVQIPSDTQRQLSESEFVEIHRFSPNARRLLFKSQSVKIHRFLPNARRLLFKSQFVEIHKNLGVKVYRIINTGTIFEIITRHVQRIRDY